MSSSVSSIASSGLRAAQLRMDVSANNVANANTPGFKPQSVQQEAAPGQGGVSARVGRPAPEPATGAPASELGERAAPSGTSLEGEAVEQIASSYAFTANLQVLRTNDRMMGSLLDTKA